MGDCDCIKLENQLCFSLYAASREVIKLYKPVLDKYNLTYTQYLTMLVLWENKCVTVKELGKKLHLDSGTLTPVLKKLEQRDLISKHRCETDDRVVIVELSSYGMKLKEEILCVPGEVFCKMNITKEQAEALKGNLDFLIKTLYKD